MAATGRARLHVAVVLTTAAVLAAVVLAGDQWAKNVALAELPYQEQVPVWGDFFVLYLTKNPGAAFSLGADVTWLFTVILGLAALIVIFLLITRVRSRLWTVTLGLLLGGVLGNLTDRLTRDPGFPVGHVIDFIYTPWMMPAIYNIADCFVVTMMIAVAAMILFGLRLDGTRDPSRKHTAPDPEDDAPAAPDADPEAGSDATAPDPADAAADLADDAPAAPDADPEVGADPKAASDATDPDPADAGSAAADDPVADADAPAGASESPRDPQFVAKRPGSEGVSARIGGFPAGDPDARERR